MTTFIETIQSPKLKQYATIFMNTFHTSLQYNFTVFRKEIKRTKESNPLLDTILNENTLFDMILYASDHKYDEVLSFLFTHKELRDIHLFYEWFLDLKDRGCFYYKTYEHFLTLHYRHLTDEDKKKIRYYVFYLLRFCEMYEAIYLFPILHVTAKEIKEQYIINIIVHQGCHLIQYLYNYMGKDFFVTIEQLSLDDYKKYEAFLQGDKLYKGFLMKRYPTIIMNLIIKNEQEKCVYMLKRIRKEAKVLIQYVMKQILINTPLVQQRFFKMDSIWNEILMLCVEYLDYKLLHFVTYEEHIHLDEELFRVFLVQEKEKFQERVKYLSSWTNIQKDLFMIQENQIIVMSRVLYEEYAFVGGNTVPKNIFLRYFREKK